VKVVKNMNEIYIIGSIVVIGFAIWNERRKLEKRLEIIQRRNFSSFCQYQNKLLEKDIIESAEKTTIPPKVLKNLKKFN